MKLSSDLKRHLFSYSILDNYRLRSFTTTRNGGVSKGNYESLNIYPYSNDDIADVATNRELLSSYLELDPDDLYIPRQIHEDKIHIVNEDFLNLTKEEKEQKLNGIDALITQEKNIFIGISTADCVPILIYDSENHVLGAVHAGWKGTVKRIGSKVVNIMAKTFQSKTENLIVAIGPSISQKMFEVGDEVGEAFLDAGFDLNNLSYRNKKTGKLHIDLWIANEKQLLELGVRKEHIEIAGICTYSDETFFSARRQTINSGRMVTGGMLI